MALLTEKSLVNYDEQEAAFVDFLKHFKSSSTEAEEQLEGLTLNGSPHDDEYDMLDDSDDPAPGSQRSRSRNLARPSKVKYMHILQDVANRERSDILIDLNDLEAVRV